jgi:hypothetical protein
LFGLLAAAGGGVWDNLRQEFVFRSNEGADVFDCGFFGIPCVKVDETAPAPVSVSGFWERPWEGGYPEGIPDVTPVVNKHGRNTSETFSASKARLTVLSDRRYCHLYIYCVRNRGYQ